jgi:hypothetical protein
MLAAIMIIAFDMDQVSPRTGHGHKEVFMDTGSSEGKDASQRVNKMASNPIIWSPGTDRVEASAMYRFMRQSGFDDYASLYQWSVDHSPAFWEAVCEFCDVVFDKEADQILQRPDDIMDAGWFAGSQLNYAANLLRNDGDDTAIVFIGENGTGRELSHTDLRNEGCRLFAQLPGDRNRDAGDNQYRSSLVVVFTGFRGQRGCRPFRSDHAKSPVRNKWLFL